MEHTHTSGARMVSSPSVLSREIESTGGSRASRCGSALPVKYDDGKLTVSSRAYLGGRRKKNQGDRTCLVRTREGRSDHVCYM